MTTKLFSWQLLFAQTHLPHNGAQHQRHAYRITGASVWFDCSTISRVLFCHVTLPISLIHCTFLISCTVIEDTFAKLNLVSYEFATSRRNHKIHEDIIDHLSWHIDLYFFTILHIDRNKILLLLNLKELFPFWANRIQLPIVYQLYFIDNNRKKIK